MAATRDTKFSKWLQ
jgi:hypothetical protein